MTTGVKHDAVLLRIEMECCGWNAYVGSALMLGSMALVRRDARGAPGAAAGIRTAHARLARRGRDDTARRPDARRETDLHECGTRRHRATRDGTATHRLRDADRDVHGLELGERVRSRGARSHPRRDAARRLAGARPVAIRSASSTGALRSGCRTVRRRCARLEHARRHAAYRLPRRPRNVITMIAHTRRGARARCLSASRPSERWPAC